MNRYRIVFLTLSILLLITGVALEGNVGIALFCLGFLILFVMGVKEKQARIKRRMES